MAERPLTWITAATAVFCLALAYLALTMRAGGDPALGAVEPQPAAQPRQVLVRRVIVRRVIEEPAAAVSAGPAGAAAPAASAPSAAPAAAAPSAPAAAPAPPPPPPAPVTRAS